MSTRFGWTHASTLRSLKDMSPELFAEIHADTPRKWRREGRGDTEDSSKLGRPQLLDDAKLHHLASLCHAVSAKIFVGTRTMAKILARELEALDSAFVPSREWTRKFLHTCHIRCRRAASSSAAAQTRDDQVAAQLNLKKKIE
jgi:hypothetical protein